MAVTVTSKTHAIVIGGSMAGLVTARTASNHCDRVTLIDRDHFPDKPQDRRGVPQARHAPALLLRGQHILEGLFPGLEQDLTQGGAPEVNWMRDIQLLTPYAWLQRTDFGYVSHIVSRVLLEWHIRERVLANPKPSAMLGCDVLGLTMNADKTRVTGIRYQSREPGSREKPSSIPTLPMPPAGIQRPQALKADWKVLWIALRPPHLPRSSALFEVENGQWTVTLAGACRDYPPTDEAGFLEFTRSFAAPDLYEAIKDADPTTAISGYQKTRKQFRHYEELARWPDHFIVMADAVGAFNPIYGQGMTVAAIEGQQLDKSLSQQRQRAPQGDFTGVEHQFQKQIKALTSIARLLATTEDFRYPDTEGERVEGASRWVRNYFSDMFTLLPESTAATRAVVEFQHVLKPPTVLFQPRIAARVLVHMVVHPGKQDRVPAHVPGRS